MINLTITEQQLQASFEKSLEQMLSAGNYNNPVKALLEDMLPRSYKIDTPIGVQIKNYILELVEDQNFKLEIRRAAAQIFAEKMLEAAEKKNTI
jgi:hypothetical protein